MHRGMIVSMARSVITPGSSTVPHTGPAATNELTEAATDAAEFNSFVNDGRTYLAVRNKDAAATHTVKFKDGTTGTQIGQTFVIPKSKVVVFGPFPVFQDFTSTVFFDANSAELVCFAWSLPKFAGSQR